MASQAGAEDTATKWSKHIWSAQAVRDAITKSCETIKLVSSQDQVTVVIHRELLCFYSAYYNAALNGNFNEAGKDSFNVDLSGGDLRRFLAWIYSGEMDETSLLSKLYLYVFADQVDVMAFRRELVNDLVPEQLLKYDMVKVVLANLTHSSPLYKLVLDSYITRWDSNSDNDDPCPLDSETDPDHLMANFIYQLMKGKVCQNEPGKMIPKARCDNPCYYHEHESEQEWEATCGVKKDTKRPASLWYT